MAHTPPDHESRLARALLSLDGLSVGDAFGERFFVDQPAPLIAARALPEAPWTYTDDTVLSLALFETLRAHGRVVQDDLALRFARCYAAEPERGYGRTAHRILQALNDGQSWETAAGQVRGGEGSMGNGGAMRVAPLGAYFSPDLEAAAEQARRSAQVTHAHAEGQAGAVAVAVAAAQAAASNPAEGLTARDAGRSLLESALDWTPEGLTREGLSHALTLPFETPVDRAAQLLGNGSRGLSWDTVPLTLWCAARHLDNYEEALWATVSALGDRDTTCAIVGGLVALAVGVSGIPSDWLNAREALPPLSRP